VWDFLSALVVAVVVYEIVGGHVLPDPLSGALAGLLFVALLVLVPTHRALSPRLACNLALFVGWTPVLWWVDWPVAVNHGAAVLAVGVGVLVSKGRRASTRAKLMPDATRADLLLPLSAVVSGLAVSPWLLVRTPQAALSHLLPGADNWAHFDMFMNLRAYGATSLAMGATPDWSGWAYGTYPQGFHAVVATLSELSNAGLTPGPEGVLVYARTVAVLVVLGTVLVTASVLSLPGVPSRPLVALPLLSLTWTGMVWEPGQKVLADGFANFWLATVAVAVAVLIAVTIERRSHLWSVAAVAGLLLLTCHSWTPLVILALPAVVLVCRRVVGVERWRGRRAAGVLLIAVLALTGAAVAVLTLFRTVSVHFLVTVGGGFDGASPLPTFLLTIAACLLPPALSRRLQVAPTDGTLTTADRDLSRRVRALLLTPGVGVVVLALLLVAQMRQIGTTSYYFLKMFMGFELVLMVMVPGLVAMLLASVMPRSRSRSVATAVAVVAALAATQAFGVLGPGRALLFSHTDDGTAAISAPYSRAAMAAGILAAVSATRPSDSFDEEYLPLGRGNALQSFYPDVWFHAMNASATADALERLAALRVPIAGPRQAAPIARRLLVDNPRLRLLVPPAEVDGLRAALDDPALAARVSTSASH
jgi:hypothetical protein